MFMCTFYVSLGTISLPLNFLNIFAYSRRQIRSKYTYLIFYECFEVFDSLSLLLTVLYKKLFSGKTKLSFVLFVVLAGLTSLLFAALSARGDDTINTTRHCSVINSTSKVYSTWHYTFLICGYIISFGSLTMIYCISAGQKSRSSRDQRFLIMLLVCGISVGFVAAPSVVLVGIRWNFWEVSDVLVAIVTGMPGFMTMINMGINLRYRQDFRDSFLKIFNKNHKMHSELSRRTVTQALNVVIAAELTETTVCTVKPILYAPYFALKPLSGFRLSYLQLHVLVSLYGTFLVHSIASVVYNGVLKTAQASQKHRILHAVAKRYLLSCYIIVMIGGWGSIWLAYTFRFIVDDGVQICMLDFHVCGVEGAYFLPQGTEFRSLVRIALVVVIKITPLSKEYKVAQSNLMIAAELADTTLCLLKPIIYAPSPAVKVLGLDFSLFQLHIMASVYGTFLVHSFCALMYIGVLKAGSATQKNRLVHSAAKYYILFVYVSVLIGGHAFVWKVYWLGLLINDPEKICRIDTALCGIENLVVFRQFDQMQPYIWLCATVESDIPIPATNILEVHHPLSRSLWRCDANYNPGATHCT
ncbi:unnamed protein product, partial [Mesorhabditis spiculigera]